MTAFNQDTFGHTVNLLAQEQSLSSGEVAALYASVAGTLRVEPSRFPEYRLAMVMERLESSPTLALRVYRKVCDQ